MLTYNVYRRVTVGDDEVLGELLFSLYAHDDEDARAKAVQLGITLGAPDMAIVTDEIKL